MRHESEFWFDSLAGLVAVLAIPFYLGLVHLTVGQLVIYSGAAGVGMATGEQFQYGIHSQEWRWEFARTAAMWTLAALILGGVAYVIAVILI